MATTAVRQPSSMKIYCALVVRLLVIYATTDPSPSGIASNPIHLAYSSCEESSECSSESRRAEEEGEAFLRLIPSIPPGLAVSYCDLSHHLTQLLHSNQVEASRKHAGLEDPQEEPGRIQPTSVLYEPLHDCDEAETQHIQRKPNMRLELFEHCILSVASNSSGVRTVNLRMLDGISSTQYGTKKIVNAMLNLC